MIDEGKEGKREEAVSMKNSVKLSKLLSEESFKDSSVKVLVEEVPGGMLTEVFSGKVESYQSNPDMRVYDDVRVFKGYVQKKGYHEIQLYPWDYEQALRVESKDKSD